MRLPRRECLRRRAAREARHSAGDHRADHERPPARPRARPRCDPYPFPGVPHEHTSDRRAASWNVPPGGCRVQKLDCPTDGARARQGVPAALLVTKRRGLVEGAGRIGPLKARSSRRESRSRLMSLFPSKAIRQGVLPVPECAGVGDPRTTHRWPGLVTRRSTRRLPAYASGRRREVCRNEVAVPMGGHDGQWESSPEAAVSWANPTRRCGSRDERVTWHRPC
jgi:hypothetical protein